MQSKRFPSKMGSGCEERTCGMRWRCLRGRMKDGSSMPDSCSCGSSSPSWKRTCVVLVRLSSAPLATDPLRLVHVTCEPVQPLDMSELDEAALSVRSYHCQAANTVLLWAENTFLDCSSVSYFKGAKTSSMVPSEQVSRSSAEQLLQTGAAS